MDVGPGAVGLFEEDFTVAFPVDDRTAPATESDIQVLVGFGVLEAGEGDPLVGERFLAEIIKVDDLGERARPLDGVTAGDAATFVFGLALEDGDVETVPGGRRRRRRYRTIRGAYTPCRCSELNNPSVGLRDSDRFGGGALFDYLDWNFTLEASERPREAFRTPTLRRGVRTRLPSPRYRRARRRRRCRARRASCRRFGPNRTRRPVPRN